MHRNVLICATAVLLGLAAQAGAQTTIPWNRIPREVGTMMEYKTNEPLEPVPVEVGNQGGPQTWSFDTTFPGYFFDVTIVDKDDTPFGPDFPDANLATRGDDSEPVVVYTFSHLSENSYDGLGIGMTYSGERIVARYDSVFRQLKLPLQMGTNWRFATSYRFDYAPGDFSVFTEIGNPHVDAWGNAELVFGSYSCLRVTSIDTFIAEHTIGGVPEPPVITFWRMYWWYAPDLGLIASAYGPDGDTALVFTESDNYNVMVLEPARAVAELPQRPVLSRLPVATPFVGRTTVPGRPEEFFELYDVTGKLVARQQGDAIGRGLPTGVYTIRSGSGESARVVKLGR